MKWPFFALGVMVAASLLGCRGGEISSDGKVVHAIAVRPLPQAPPGALEIAEDAIRAIPSKVPTVNRLEWGRLDPDRDESHCLLVTFNDPESLNDPRYLNALNAVDGRDQADGPYARLPAYEYLFHDSTPDVHTAVHGRLRRRISFALKEGTQVGELQKLEDAMAALPRQVPDIERFEWGTRIPFQNGIPKTIDPTYRAPVQAHAYLLVFTFKSTRARDACLAHPAYKKFLGELERYVERKPHELEYVANVEYVARPD